MRKLLLRSFPYVCDGRSGGGAGPRELRLGVLAVIHRTVGFDAYAWLVTDPETAVGSSPLAARHARTDTLALAR